MLVLTRRKEESLIIKIDDVQIKIKCLSISSSTGGVRLGVSAPKHVLIDREEIYKKRIQAKAMQKKHDEINFNRR